MSAQQRKTAGYVLDRAIQLLNDPQSETWSRARLLTYLNSAQREVSNVRPEAYVRTVPVELVAGSRQALPSDAKYLIDVVCNLDGEDHGLACTLAKREDCDRSESGWRKMDRSSAVVENYMYDERAPRLFDVYPPSDGESRELLIEYAGVPQDVPDESTEIALSDEYIDPMVYWICRMAYSEETESPEYKANAEYYRAMFLESLGVQDQRLMMGEPGQSREEIGGPERIVP